MAKKNGLLTAIAGVGAIAVAGKLAHDKYKKTKEIFIQEELDSEDYEVRKFNAICESKEIEYENEEFVGCELKGVMSNMVLDLGLADFSKDVYINFSSTASKITIVVPEGLNVVCDVKNNMSTINNMVENVEEDGIFTLYIIGKATTSNLEIIPVEFYVDDEDDFEDIDDSVIKESDFVDEEIAVDEPVQEDTVEEESEIEEKSVTEKIADRVADVKEKVTPVVEDVKEKVAPVVEDVKEKVAPVVEDVKEKVAPVVDDIKEKFSSVVGETEDSFVDEEETDEDKALAEAVNEAVEEELAMEDVADDTVTEKVEETLELSDEAEDDEVLELEELDEVDDTEDVEETSEDTQEEVEERVDTPKDKVKKIFSGLKYTSKSEKEVEVPDEEKEVKPKRKISNMIIKSGKKDE